MTLLHWVGLGFLAWAIATVSWSYDEWDTGWGLWTLSILALTFTLGSAVTTLRGVWIGMALGLSVSSLVAIAQFFGYLLRFTAYSICTEGTFCTHVAGIYHNSAVQGAILALLIVALASERLYWFIPALVPALLLSSSRGAIIAVVIGLHHVAFRSLALIAILGCTFAAAFFISIGPTDLDRFAIWRITLLGLNAWGWGPGSFLGVATSSMYPEHVHNDILQLAFEYGAGSLLLFFCYACGLFCRDSRETPVLVTFLTLSLFFFPHYLPITGLVGALVAGRLARDWSLVRSDGDSRGHSLPTRESVEQVRSNRVRGAAVPLG